MCDFVATVGLIGNNGIPPPQNAPPSPPTLLPPRATTFSFDYPQSSYFVRENQRKEFEPDSFSTFCLSILIAVFVHSFFSRGIIGEIGDF